MVTGGALAGCGGGGGGGGGEKAADAPARTIPARPLPSGTGVPATNAPPAPAAATTYVAQAVPARVAVFPAAGAAAPQTTLANPNENGAPLVFLVEQTQGDWIKVDLPIRPNGSTGWVRAADVKLAADPYSVDIALSAHRLTVHKGDQVVADEPIGVGTSETPTPGGTYYIKELLRPPNPNGAYGPYAYGLSGFSNVLDDFNGGDGVIGIHGTNEPSAIGHDVSHGCIRLNNKAIEALVPMLPLGTPVHITA
jgi:lipoprotein-anchoring transpeptidase ErfK/SrfK